MALDVEHIVDGGVETLCRSRRLEALHTSFALAQWLMGILCPVILPATCVTACWMTLRGKRWRRYESLSIRERYTVRPYQASVTVTVPSLGKDAPHGRPIERFGDVADAAAACRKLNPHIMVMQSGQDETAEYATNGFDSARDGRILVQGQMRARLIVVDPMERRGYESWPPVVTGMTRGALLMTTQCTSTTCVAWHSDPANRHGSVHSRRRRVDERVSTG